MIRTFTLGVVLCVLLLPCSGLAVNLLANPGFEDSAGFSPPWFSWADCGVEPWAARTGTNGASLWAWNVGSYGGFGQDVPVTSHASGDIFTFSIAAMAEESFGTAAGFVFLKMDLLAGETITTTVVYNVYADLTSHRGSWITLTASHTNFDDSINTVRVLVVAEDYAPAGSGPMACMWDDASFQVVNLSEPRLLLDGDDVLYIGTSNAWQVQINSASGGDITVAVTSSAPGVATVPAEVIVPAGATSATFFVSGVATGEAHILVSSAGWQSAQMTARVDPQVLTLDGIQSFYAGTTSTWTLIRHGPSTADTTVSLSNSAPSALQAPAQVIVSAGSTSVAFDVTGLAPGSGSLSAHAENFQPASRSFSVFSWSLGLTGPATLYARMTNTCTVTRFGPVQGDLTVSLSNNTPSVLDAPASVLLADGESSAVFHISGLATGNATLDVYAPGYDSTGILVSVAANTLSLSGSSTIPLGGSSVWTVARAGALQQSLEVTLSVDDPDVIGLPASVIIPPDEPSSTFTVSGLGAWTATVTASCADYLPAAKAAEVSRGLLQNPGFEDAYGFAPAWFPWGNCSVEPWASHAGSNGVALHGWVAGSFGGFAQDVSVTSHAEGDVYTFSIDAMAEDGFGSSSGNVLLQMQFLQGATLLSTHDANIYPLLTASRGSWNRYALTCTNADTAADTVRVIVHAADYDPQGYLVAAMWDSAELMLIAGSPSNLYLAGGDVYAGGTSTWTVRRSGSTAEALTVSLTSLNTNTLTVPASILIPAGTNAATFEIAGLALGTTAIKASAPGQLSTWQLLTVHARGLLLAGTAQLYVASTNSWTITRTGPSGDAIDITLSSSMPQAAAVPASVGLAPGVTSAVFDVICDTAGAATLTASATGYSSTSRTVSVAQRSLALSGLTNAYVGISNAWTLTRNGPLADGLTVALSNDNPSAASAPANVDFGPGETSLLFHVTAQQTGNVYLAAAAPGYAPAGLGLAISPNRLELTGARTLALGQSNRCAVTRTGPVSQPLTVDLAVDQPSVLDAPKDVTIPAGTNAAAFFVTGLAFGDATIAATADGFLSAELGIKVENNLLRNPGFEEDASWGDAWMSWGSIGVESWAAETGDRGVALHGWVEGSYGGFAQDVAITTSTGGDVYVFSLNGRRDPDFRSGTGQLALLIQFCDADLQAIHSITNSIYADFISRAEPWSTYVASGVNTNTNACVVRVALLADDYAPSGGLCAAMWDNADLQKHPMNGNSLLLTGRGSGFEGSSNRWLITRVGSCEDSLTVTLTSDETDVAVVDSTVVIPAGTAFAELTVRLQTNATPGFRRLGGTPLSPSATITAQADGYPPTNKLISAEANQLMLAGPASVILSFSNRWTVSRSGLLASPLSITLSTDHPELIDIPAIVSMPAGIAAADFHVTGTAAGTATLTATADGYLSTSRTVCVTNVSPDVATQPTGDATLFWQGLAGSRYLIEEAGDIRGPWTQVKNIYCGQNGLLQWEDTSFASATSRYYRILMLITNAPDQAYSR